MAALIRQDPHRGQTGGLQWEHLRYLVIGILLAMIWLFPNPNAVSFREDPGAGREGTMLVQLLWFGLLGLGLLCIQERWTEVRRQFDLTLILMLGWCAMTVPIAILPDVSMRRYIFTAVGVVVAVFCVSSPRRAEALLWILLGALVVETFAKYFMVFAYPSLGRHPADGLEPQLVGLWRGQYAHKNGAGPVCALELFILFAARGKVPGPYLLGLAALEIFFLFMAGSKTPLYLFALVMLIAHYVVRNRSLLTIMLPVVAAVAFMNILTIGSTLSPTVYTLAGKILGDATFTGRTEIWALLMQYTGDHPITGSGFLSFWQIGFLSPAMQNGSGWASTAAYGHQGYLDLAASIGIPGLALVLLFLILRPCVDLVHTTRRGHPMLTMFVSFWIFGLLTNCTESGILARADGVWLFTVIGIAGIRRFRAEDAAASAAVPVAQNGLPAAARRRLGPARRGASA